MAGLSESLLWLRREYQNVKKHENTWRIEAMKIQEIIIGTILRSDLYSTMDYRNQSLRMVPVVFKLGY